ENHGRSVPILETTPSLGRCSAPMPLGISREFHAAIHHHQVQRLLHARFRARTSLAFSGPIDTFYESSNRSLLGSRSNLKSQIFSRDADNLLQKFHGSGTRK